MDWVGVDLASVRIGRGLGGWSWDSRVACLEAPGGISRVEELVGGVRGQSHERFAPRVARGLLPRQRALWRLRGRGGG